MEWTASAPVAATSNVSAPKPPNNPVGPLHPKNNEKDRDVPMRELTEETKGKKQSVVDENKKKEPKTNNK